MTIEVDDEKIKVVKLRNKAKWNGKRIFIEDGRYDINYLEEEKVNFLGKEIISSNINHEISVGEWIHEGTFREISSNILNDPRWESNPLNSLAGTKRKNRLTQRHREDYYDGVTKRERWLDRLNFVMEI